jgi:hypothetical protein
MTSLFTRTKRRRTRPSKGSDYSLARVYRIDKIIAGSVTTVLPKSNDNRIRVMALAVHCRVDGRSKRLSLNFSVVGQETDSYSRDLSASLLAGGYWPRGSERVAELGRHPSVDDFDPKALDTFGFAL